MIRSNTSRSFPAAAVAALITATLLFALVAPSAALAATSPTFTIGGGGWGHGIGLSQWGAKGYAEQGKSGQWIAARYYPGATIATRSDRTIRVNIDNDANYSTPSSSYNGGYTRTSWGVRPGHDGGTLKLNDTYVLSDTWWTVSALKSGSTVLGITVSDGSTTYGPFSSVKIAHNSGGSPALVQVRYASGPFGHTYLRYRGTMRIYTNSSTVGDAPAGSIKMLNQLGMNDYLAGVVPRESPSSWPAAALEAQAIVARSYAHGSPSELYCNTWSQVYNGHSRGDRTSPTMHEAASTNAAIVATSFKYVEYGGDVVQTFFHSSSGGHTANIEDVWLSTGQPSSTHPYRAGVSSPYEASAGDPNASWPLTEMSGMTMADKLDARYPSYCPSGAGSSVYVERLTMDRADSGFVRTMDIYWSNGSKTNDFRGDYFRTALGLKSTKFYIAGFPMDRIYGSNRYGTAAEVSRRAFSSTAPVVVVASGEDYADALAGSALAGVRGGPILLTASGYLPPETRDELERLNPSEVYVLGGTAALPDSILSQIGSAAGVTPERIAGPDRYSTARLVAEEVQTHSPTSVAMVASGVSWPDAASLSALAYARGYPILLSEKSTLTTATAQYLDATQPASVFVAGGTAVLAPAVDTQITAASGTSPTRFAGSDRYRTATLIAEYCLANGFSADDVYVATGEVYADVLTGGVAAGTAENPLILTQRDRCPSNTGTWLADQASQIEKLYLLGGDAAISDAGIMGIGIAMSE